MDGNTFDYHMYASFFCILPSPMSIFTIFFQLNVNADQLRAIMLDYECYVCEKNKTSASSWSKGLEVEAFVQKRNSYFQK